MYKDLLISRIEAKNLNPEQIADSCLKVKYPGPFEFIFYCYYAFPTDYPEHIQRLFGKEYFKDVIKPEAMGEFRNTIQETGVDVVVTFNKGIFNVVSNDRIEKYIERLVEGELVRSQIDGINRMVPIFLTFPTGWRYHRDYKKLRKVSLDIIKTVLGRGINAPGSKNKS